MRTSMKRTLLHASLLVAALPVMQSACDKGTPDRVGSSQTSTAGSTGTATGTGTMGGTGTAQPGAATGAQAENTRINERDRPRSAITPMDQGNNAADLDTTQKIRKAIMDDESLSSNAKNSKVITANGVIVLRGPVKSEDERRNIESKARQAAGANRVENQLEVTTSDASPATR